MSDTQLSITVNNVGKCYRMYKKPNDRLKQAFSKNKNKYFKEFWALRDISLNIKRGETVGIVGRNGSGKSTLLQIIAGTLSPTEGEVKVYGKVSALLELGSGFNPEFTGRENVYLSGSIYGIQKEQMKEKIDKILEFAGIGEFIDQPVKVYSSGMYARLAFAVAIFVEPEVLIVDEILSVGDIRFQQKCINKLNEMKKRGCTILFVSHSIYQVQALCDWAILLDQGELISEGDPKTIGELYHKRMFETISEDTNDYESCREKTCSITTTKEELDEQRTLIFKENSEFLKQVENRRFGTGQVRIVNAELLDENGNQASNILINREVTVRVHLKANSDQRDLVTGISVINSQGIICYATNTYVESFEIKEVKENSCLVLDFKFFAHISPSKYTITIGCGDYNSIENPIYFDWIDSAIEFDVLGEKHKLYYSVFYMPSKISIAENE